MPSPIEEARELLSAQFNGDEAHEFCANKLPALLAEIDRLRAEVDRLTFEMSCLQQQYDERTAHMIVHRGAALACSDSVRAAYSDEHERAERQAEALRWAERHCPCGARPESPDTHPHLPGCLVGAALAQEER